MEIKFRGFDKISKRMFDVYGLGKDWVTEETMDGVNPGVNCFDSDDFEQNIYIMQYTSIKDNNGNEIYEGDIVISKNGFRGIVKFGEFKLLTDSFGITYKCYGWHFEFEDKSGCTAINSEMKIIGNIHQGLQPF